MKINNKYELLAPVGNIEMFEAALAAKANAVYLAGYKFGARAYASNFDLEQLNNLVIKAHKHEMKVFLTLNTLVKDEEFPELYQYLKELKTIGVDALIIQDLGVYRFIKEYFPGFELHASTQMTVNNLLGAKYIEKLGFERIVVGREVSLQEIKYIANDTNLEIEAFIHGSLCVSVSGQCLMSSLIGQRSGNRGRCAQPCRKTYDIYNKEGKKISQVPDTFISARDLMTIESIGTMLSAGVYSLKIEGRMKKPDYVYAVVNEYRKALEGIGFDQDKLSLVSNRKFTKGLFLGDFGSDFYNSKDDVAGFEVGRIFKDDQTKLIFTKEVYKGDVISVITDKNKRLNLTMTGDFKPGESMILNGYKDLKEGSDIYKLYSERIVQELEQSEENLIPIDFEVYAYIGQRLKADIIHKDQTISLESDFFVQEAQKKATTEEEIHNQFSRLGNTGYQLGKLKVNMDRGIFLAKSKLNELRRDLVDALDKSFSGKMEDILEYRELEQPYRDSEKKYDLTYEYYYDFNEDINLNVFKRIYVHDMTTIERLRQLYHGDIYFVIPRIIEKDDFEQLMVDLTKNIEDIKGFSLSTLGDIEAMQRFDMPLHLEATLNIFNSYALDFFRKQGLDDFSLSHELNHTEMSQLKIRELEQIEIMAFGKISQMLMKHCPAAVIKGCKDDKNCKSCPFSRDLKLDNPQDTMFVNRAYGYSEVLTDRPVNLINEKALLDKTPVNLLRIVDRGEDIKPVVDKFIKRFIENDEIEPVKSTYTGHFKLGVI